jgi:hypothetical protein
MPADLVFATSTPPTIALTGVYDLRRQKVPMVFEEQDLWPKLPVAKATLCNPVTRLAAQRLERFAYQSLAEIVALSPGMAKVKYV